ncbi:uncharacterized protein CANTADRAFT_24158 [Suhomyces tanzawaensis NRRL Y-17324]|uniref:C2H2-type domain-containing protein n=1 Tax=Suhomyces tanzawaensis NRRL Y-17324 TaxID=984487 RepID=A0A1E4SBM1_9ASCO|nr:uncharacterized protein CANTADRAFT_24158 [Suhomyces tanzawaensis NRRL Y-17324]ODV76899.1 hypothetical protein CANTADRAFT_24158 [Suhomyces tanzawaensis NRRL Y-17324]
MEFPIEMALFQPLYSESTDQDLHTLAAQPSFDYEPDFDTRGSASNATHHNLQNTHLHHNPQNHNHPNLQNHPDSLNLNDEIFLANELSYSDLAQMSLDYNYHFAARGLSSPLVSLASSIPMAVSYDAGMFPSINTPQVEVLPQLPLTSPLHGFHRHHSTTIPVDQLNLLSIKTMAAPPLASSTEQVSKSPSPDYYYTTGSHGKEASSSSTLGQDGFDFDKLAEEMGYKEMGYKGENPYSKTSELEYKASEMPYSKAKDDTPYSRASEMNYSKGGLGYDKASEMPFSKSEISSVPYPNPDVLPKTPAVPQSSDAARTINPRELFTSSKIPTSLSSPALTTLYALNGSHTSHTSSTNPLPQSINFKGFSASSGFPNIPNLPNQALSSGMASKSSVRAPKFDFKMNDECYNAISYWLNNTLLSAESEDDPDAFASGPADEATKIMVNPTGIIKGNYGATRSRPHSFSASHSSYAGVTKRRNSIQLSNPSSYTQQVPTLKKLDSQQMNEEDEDDEVILDSAGSFHEIAPPSILSAGQKNKRRKSYTTEDASSRGFLENPKLEASMTYSQMNAQPQAPRARKTSSPNIQQDAFASTSKSKVVLTSNANSNTSAPGSASAHTIPASVPVVPNAQGAFPCSECDKQFKRSEHLKRHIRSVHSNIRPFHCKYCDKKFSRSDNLAQHLKTHYRVDANGQTTILYGNSASHARGPSVG